MIFSENFIRTVNQRNIGAIIRDDTDNAMTMHHRPFVNAMIKLGYIERVEWDKIRKIKNIPADMTVSKVRVLSKGKKLQKRQSASTWGKLIIRINNNYDNDVILLNPNDISSKRTYCGYDSIKTYLNWLANLEYIEIIVKNRPFGFKIKKLKQIPDSLTVALVQKMNYDTIYKRKAKIDKIKENLNNI